MLLFVGFVIGGAHPFVQDMLQFRIAVREPIEDWIAMIERWGGPLPQVLWERIAANDIEVLRAAVAEDRPYISQDLAGLERDYLFFAGTNGPLRPQIQRAAELLPKSRAAIT